MARTLLVVDNLSDWNPYYPSDQVITFETYLATEQGESSNVSASSIFAVATVIFPMVITVPCWLKRRGHHVIPSVKVLNDLAKKHSTNYSLKTCHQL